MCDTNNIVDSIGYSGGVVLSVCLIPQIYTIYKSKEVENISYMANNVYNRYKFTFILCDILQSITYICTNNS
jgi:uncharacterized protein with PQ loop repeat